MATSADDVRRVAERTDLSDDEVEGFIATANVLVEDLQGKGLSAGRIDQITLYLAAHFLILTKEKGNITVEQAGQGPARTEYKGVGNSGEEYGLSMTRFGQQALMLDKSGTLASQDANWGIRASFECV